MPNIRPKDEPLAASPAADDFLLLDGATFGTRSLPANPTAIGALGIAAAAADVNTSGSQIGAALSGKAPTSALSDLSTATVLQRQAAPFNHYYKNLTANLTLTDAAGTPNEGDGHTLTFIGHATNSYTVQIPASYSETNGQLVGTGQAIATFSVPANTEITISRRYVYNQWVVYGFPDVIHKKTLGFSFDNGTTALATASSAHFHTCLFSGTISGWTINAKGATGTNTVKFWKVAAGTEIPVTPTNVINTSGVSLTTGTAVNSTTVTDFTTTTVTYGDIVGCQLTAVDGAATQLDATLVITPN